MSTVAQTADVKNPNQSYDTPTYSVVWQNLDTILALFGLVLAVFGATIYLGLALEFRSQPFIGAFINRDLTIRNENAFGDPAQQDEQDEAFWSVRSLSIEPGDKVLRLGQTDLQDIENFDALDIELNSRAIGDTTQILIERQSGEIPDNTAWQCATVEATNCAVDIQLTQFTYLDLLGHFGVGYLAGLFVLIVSVFGYFRRPDSRYTKQFLFMGSMLAIFLMGMFDYIATHEYVYLWIFSAVSFAFSLVSFSFYFPTTLPLAKRLPFISVLSPLLAVIPTWLIYDEFFTTDTKWVFGAPVAFIGAGALVMIVIMLGWRQYTFSPILREQASYILIGVVASFTPWGILFFFEFILDFGVTTGVMQGLQIVSILFPISVAYALLQDKLLETDRLIPNMVVYGALVLILFATYLTLVVGFSLIGVKSFAATSPGLIALFAIIVSIAFAPLQSGIRDRINKLMFRQRREYQERLEVFLNKMSNALNMIEVEAAVREQLNEVLAPNAMIMFVRDTEAQVFRARPNPDTGRKITDVVFNLDGGVAEYLESEASVLYVESGKAIPPIVYQERGKLAVVNMPIWVRLKGQRQLNGFLAIDARRNGEPYTYEELRFVERIADQVALALERAQIVDDLEQRFRVQDVLSQVSRALNFAIDLDYMMELVYAQTGRVIEADIFSVAIVDRYTNEMFYAFFNKGDERLNHMEGRRWKMGRDLVSEVARTRRPIVTDDYLVELRRYDPSAKPQFPDIKAWMAVPLTAARANETLGVMVVGSIDPNIQYSDEQRQLFMDIANLASNAIDKTRLFQATQTRTQQLQALNEISSQLSYEIEDVDRLLDLITRSAMDILQVEAGSLLLIDDDHGDLEFRVAMGPNAQELVGKRIALDEQSLSAEAIKRGESIIVNDTSSDSRWHGEVIIEDEYTDEEDDPSFQSRAILTTPLITQGEPIGVLQMLNKQDSSNFNNEDEKLLITFAAQAAVAIQNARLFASQDAQLLQRVEELDQMAAIDQSLNQSLELLRVVDITLDWAIRQSGAKAGVLALVNEDKDAIQLVGVKNYPKTSQFYEKSGVSFPAEMGIWGRVIRSKTSVYTRDVTNDPDYTETYPGATSQIVVPIISANDVIGVLLIESDEETALTLIDLQFLSRLADHASPAITNARLFQQLNRQQEQRAEFVSFIAHELKTPMTSMKGYTDLLMKGIVGPVNEQQRDFLTTIYNAVNRMEGLVSDLRDIEAYEAGKMRLDMAEVDMRKVLMDSFNALKQQFDNKEQVVQLEIPDELPSVWGDERRLVQVATNFMTNANKYTPDGGNVFIRAAQALNVWDKEGVRQVLHIQIEDTGIGISEEDQKKLFREKYFRTENPKALEQPGTGLGMVLTRGLILEHGGTIWMESVIDQGTTFHFTIPLAEEIMRQAM